MWATTKRALREGYETGIVVLMTITGIAASLAVFFFFAAIVVAVWKAVLF